MEHLFNHAQKGRRIEQKNRLSTYVDKCPAISVPQIGKGFEGR